MGEVKPGQPSEPRSSSVRTTSAALEFHVRSGKRRLPASRMPPNIAIADGSI